MPAARDLPVVRSLAFILFAFVVLFSASAQEARWVQMSEQVQQLRKEGRISQAIPLAQQTVQVAQATFGPNDRHVGLSLDELGVPLSDQDDFAGAEAALRRALSIFQKISAPQSKDVGAALLSLAKFYHDHGRWGQAEGAFHASSWSRTPSPREAAIEIAKFQFHTGRTFVANRIYIALVVTPQSKYPNLIVLGDSKDLEAALTGFRSAVAKTRGVTVEPEPNAPASTAEAVNTSAAYDSFWKPIEPALTGVKRVYVAPHGVLNQLPIGLLADSGGKMVFEKYQLRYVNTTRDLLRPQHAGTGNAAVLFGNPKFDLATAAPAAATDSVQASVDLTGAPLPSLPNTQVEVAAIDKLLCASGWQPTTYFNDRATKSAITKIRAPRVLHIATHGFFLANQSAPDSSGRVVRLSSATEDPMLRSGLFFAGANRVRSGAHLAPGTDDGVLTAYEASQLDLQGTELVVLSACETGLGEQSNSEGVFGLRRALEEAGTGAIMMSMWSVPDQETQELMSLFYAKWLGGLDKPEALRQAQLQEREVVRKRYSKDLPFCWGAFVLVSR
jgi:CHAT domain-containing protein